MKQSLAILRFLRFLRDCAERGERAALVMLTDVTGSAARAPGEHMAVVESGRLLGSFSGGCVEAAVSAEAQEVLAERRARHVRYGDGSRNIDIRLPCGGASTCCSCQHRIASRSIAPLPFWNSACRSRSSSPLTAI